MIDRIVDIPQNHHFFLFGPRQTGKSSLLKKLFPQPKTLYIDLLISDTFNLYSTSPGLFREAVQTRRSDIFHVIVDEIQRIPGLLNDVHSIIESGNAPSFGLSGSSARKLKRSQANMLGGRAWTFYLYPFTHRELGARFSLHKALECGTLPPVYLEENRQAIHRTLRSYVDTYLKEEVMAEALVRNIGAFIKFLPLAADANGAVINYSNIARETGVSYNTIREYFHILEDTLLGFFLQPFSRSLRKQLSKHPKFYLFDTGVQRALLRKAGSPLQPKTYEYGQVFEHFFILELIRMSTYQEKDFRFSYYRTSNNAEVDIIVERPDNEVYAIEIKSSDNPPQKSLRGLFSFKEACDRAKLICACTTPHRIERNGIQIIPWNDVFETIGI